MAEHGAEEVEKHVRIYKKTFYALLICTVLTVAASYMETTVWLGVAIGLAIAFFKGSLVASYFMHLAWEKKLIFYILIGTAFFFVAMMVLILGHTFDVPKVHY